MGRGATKAAGNVWYEARMEAAKWNDKLLSRAGAAEALNMSEDAVKDAELGLNKCMPVDKAVLMADLYLIGNGQTEGKEVDGFESCEKFVTKTALFTGVFVGVTTLCTELFCEWNENPYGRSGYQCSSVNPKPFAIVYYAENKKRLVPMESIKKVEL